MTADAPGKVPTRNFGDVATLCEKQLITVAGFHWNWNPQLGG